MRMTMLATAVGLSLLAGTTEVEAESNHAKVPVHVLQSRKAVVRQLGQKAADQVPGYFDFRSYALVWIPHPLAEAPKVKLHEVAKTREFQFSVSLSFLFAPTKRGLAITLLPGETCSGGMARSGPAKQACLERARASEAHAAKTLNLFALNRLRARRVHATRPTTPQP